MECVHNVRCTDYLLFFVCFYLHNFHIKEMYFCFIWQNYYRYTKKTSPKYKNTRTASFREILLMPFLFQISKWIPVMDGNCEVGTSLAGECFKWSRKPPVSLFQWIYHIHFSGTKFHVFSFFWPKGFWKNICILYMLKS